MASKGMTIGAVTEATMILIHVDSLVIVSVSFLNKIIYRQTVNAPAIHRLQQKSVED